MNNLQLISWFDYILLSPSGLGATAAGLPLFVPLCAEVDASSFEAHWKPQLEAQGFDGGARTQLPHSSLTAVG